jgi:hypothetical protein
MCLSPLPGHVASHVGDLSGSLSQNQWSGSHGSSYLLQFEVVDAKYCVQDS